jgi:hypothetical protein
VLPAEELRAHRSTFAAAARRGRLRVLDGLTLVAVGVVVLLVSLPRLREFALDENEGDARRLVAHLGELLSSPVHAADEPAADPANVEQLIHGSRELARQLDDAEYLDQGRLLRRHGYLFELTPRASPGSVTGVRAWPWHYRQTGLSAFAWTPDAGLQGHANDGGRWSGPQQPPNAPDLAAGWKVIVAR